MCNNAKTNTHTHRTNERPHPPVKAPRPVHGLQDVHRPVKGERDERPHHASPASHATRDLPPEQHTVHCTQVQPYACCQTQTASVQHTREQRVQQIRQRQFSVQSARSKKYPGTCQNGIEFSVVLSCVQYSHRDSQKNLSSSVHTETY
jgi:hypothetical protein